ncbi:hypothetical protein BJF79_42865 [Actinomadura sp. CNU-125]|uniref:cytochrome P450 n=1 Tax=Actinomadura sp. CNU-125 TaxID=1904961 RepID=UPI00096517FB|nr:cytochrome P450 [Actinomadura sp. CNU-125]OLT27099.1 hypothetical protein BJF79_42865 [Actinomadura sp. CNU-125]
MTADPAEELDFPPATPTPLAPAPVYERLRGSAPVVRVRLPNGDRAWLVTRHDDNRLLFADRRLSRRAAALPGAPRLRAAPLETRSITTLDPPEHTRIRKLVQAEFTTGRVERLRPRITEVTDELLDRMSASARPADLVAGLARPLPIAVISEFLGIPERDRTRFREWTEGYLGNDRTGIENAESRLKGYFADLIDRRRRSPGDDMFSVLATAPPEQRIDDEDLVVLGVTLLVAGFETVANQIATATVVLLRRPAGLRPLAERPGLVPSAVEELLRYTPVSVSGGTIRVAVDEVDIGGTRIRADEGVLPSIVSANRDDAVFADPDELRLDRDPNPHIAFGHGVHRCLGAQLARAELQVAFGRLSARMPGLRLAVPFTELDWNRTGMIRGPRAVPVTW